MKRLVITNGIPRYLDTSFAGSYYVPCKIIEKNEKSIVIEYVDFLSEEKERKTISKNDIEYERKYFDLNKESQNDLYEFLESFRKNKIDINTAMKVIKNGGSITQDIPISFC